MAAVDVKIFGGALRTSRLWGVWVPVLCTGAALVDKRVGFALALENTGYHRSTRLLPTSNEAADAAGPHASIASVRE
jgi:hypothetical protein